MHLGDIQFSVGGARVEKGNDKRDVFHGTFFKKYDNFIFGLGGQTDNKNDTYAHFVFGQHPKEKGKGFGWRVLGFSELEGDFTAELMLTLDSNFSKWSYYGIADPYTYFHEKKMRITDNVMDYFIPATELFKRTNGTAALEFNFNKDNKGNQSLLIDSAVYPTGVLRKLGMDIGKGPLDNVWIGGGYNTGKKQGIFKAGIRHKDFIVYGTKPEGERPALSFGFYRGF